VQEMAYHVPSGAPSRARHSRGLKAVVRLLVVRTFSAMLADGLLRGVAGLVVDPLRCGDKP
jgi:hypothetical protein